MPDTVDESLAVEVGRRLRERRQSRNETLETVATATEISISHLAEIETGKTSCSLPVLIRLSQVLAFPLGEILPTLGRPRLKVDTVGGDAEQRVISEPGLDLIVRSVALKKGRSVDIGLDGCDVLVYVVSGTCEIDVEGIDGRTALGPGDSADVRRSSQMEISASSRLTALVVIGSRSADGVD